LKILDKIFLVQVNIIVLFRLKAEMQGKFARGISLIAKSLQTWILADDVKVEHDTTMYLVSDFGD